MENRVSRPKQDGKNQHLFIKYESKHSVFSCGCHGWLLIKEPHECFLWNAFTLESIHLPSLDSEAAAAVNSCVLSSPPDTPGSLILIFFRNGYSFMFCRVVGDQHWTEQSVTHIRDYSLRSPVCCNGKLYAIAKNLTENRSQLLEIDPNIRDGHLVIHVHGNMPSWKDHSTVSYPFMVESCGEIFTVYLLRGGKLLQEVIGVEVFKLDCSLMQWTQVKSAKDRVFFLDLWSGYSYQTANQETEGNRIYFTSYDRRMYTFHIEDNTVAASSPYPDLKSPWGSRIWIMTPTCSSSSSSSSSTSSRLLIDDVIKVEKNPKKKKQKTYLQGDDDEEGKDLPIDILSSIARLLALHDYNNFRLLNRTFRLGAPPVLARNLPWLLSCKRGEDKCRFTSPLQQTSYLMKNPNGFDNVRMCYSKKGWCLMIQSNKNPHVFLWNPFAKKIIPLPASPVDDIVGCEFLSSPDTSHCFIVYIRRLGEVDYISVNQGTTETRFVLDRGSSRLSFHNNPVFCKGNLCLVDSRGTLIVFKPDESFSEVKRPCNEFYQSFLLEANGKLLVVFLGFMGKWLRVFEMDLSDVSKLVWIEVDDVGDKTIHVSRVSSFATTSTREEMKNTVCLPRLCGNKLIYYSLSTRKYHCYRSDVVLEDFDGTKELLYSGWIEPSS